VDWAGAFSSFVRDAYRRERIPAAARWVLAADGMASWYLMLRRGLAAPMGSRAAAEDAIATAAAAAYERRFEVLRATREGLCPKDFGPAMGALALSARSGRASFVFARLEGAPRTLVAHAAAERRLLSIAPMGFEARWREVTTHLGEVLIALGRELPARGLAQANLVLGNLCFDGGVRYGELWKNRFRLPDGPASAMEVLRSSEYLFRVNPEHWSESDGERGFLEGTACPWFEAPGWSMMHCGIFGQFQAGIGSVFGLRYQLTKTIPKHGGRTCRIDLVPLRRPSPARPGATSA
jgi:hypothetical protein